MYLTRELNTQNLEVFRVSKERFGETIAYFSIADFRRPSVLNDFPYLIGIEEESEFGSSNFIKCVILSNNEISQEEEEEYVGILEGIIGCKEDCDWNASVELTSLDLDESSFNLVFDEIKNILLNKFNHKIDIDNIDTLDFNFLMQ